LDIAILVIYLYSVETRVSPSETDEILPFKLKMEINQVCTADSSISN